MKLRDDIQIAIDEGKRLGRLALYFGCWSYLGHYLHKADGSHVYGDRIPVGFPWDDGLMDGGLLRNRNVPDIPDGKVYMTCGGNLSFWYAFYWWDRSIDKRGSCNSGIYVRGFGWPQGKEAFKYGCSQFPEVVARQKYPLCLV